MRHFLAGLDRERLATQLTLARLPFADVESMMRAIFSDWQAVPADLLRVLYALTEGNPFFIEETLQALLTAGELSYAGGAWEHKPPGTWRVPRSVQDAVQRRAERLSPAAGRVLTLAAVAGQRFDFALLQALAGLDEDDLLGRIKELIAAQLVVEASADQFAFRHALTRQAIYAQLLARERRRLHRTIAETLERLYGDARDAHLAELAYHSAEAEDWERALGYARRAGPPRAARSHRAVHARAGRGRSPRRRRPGGGASRAGAGLRHARGLRARAGRLRGRAARGARGP